MNTSAENSRAPLMRMASALFDIEVGEPSNNSRWVLRAVCLLFLVLTSWAVFAKLDIVAVAQGKLVPQTYVKIVQPAEAGVIREILVHEGDRVIEGAVLVRLDPTLNAADSTAVTRELALERLSLRRIEAELKGAGLTRQTGDDANLFMQVQAQAMSNRQSFLDSVAQEQAGRARAERELEAAVAVLSKLEQT